MVLEPREILDEHADECFGLGILGLLVGPGFARTKNIFIHTFDGDRNRKAKIKIGAHFAALKPLFECGIQQCARHLEMMVSIGEKPSRLSGTISKR